MTWTQGRTCPPYFRRVRVWGFGDSFALLAVGQFGLLSPALSDGAEPVRMGSEEAVEPLKKPCSWTTPPYPQSRPISLLAALWVGSRSSAYGQTTEPGTTHQEGDKSERSCTLERADVQDVCKAGRKGKICRMGRRYLTGCSIAGPRSLRRHQSSEVFVFVGAKPMGKS